MNRVTRLSDGMRAALRDRFAQGDISVPDLARGMMMSRWGIRSILWGKSRPEAGGAIARPVARLTVLQRFAAAVQLPSDRNGCWLWQRGKYPGGYGHFWLNGKPVGAHQFSYHTFVGPVPDGLQLDHLCRQRSCVNPDHLEPVTPQINTLRGQGPAARNAGKTHCKRGHELTGRNVRLDAQGRRVCRPCMAYLTNRWKAKQKGVLI